MRGNALDLDIATYFKYLLSVAVVSNQVLNQYVERSG